jgi:8-oxo-dGTP diphosphatase
LEETAISNEDIRLTHLMDFSYHLANCYVEVYVGRLNKKVEVFGEENELYWEDVTADFFDCTKYAGEGNIVHIMEHVKLEKARLL